MISTLLFWLRLLLYVVSCFYILQIGGLIVTYLIASEKNRREDTNNMIRKIRDPVVWFLIGFAVCDVARYSESRLVKGPITVMEAYPNNEYRLQTPDYGNLDTRLCPPAPQFQQGHVLKYIKYRYDYPRGCWMVNMSGGFDVFIQRD